MTYRIRDWQRHFEVSQSKRAKLPDRLTWVATPNKHDGKSYKRLLRMKDGISLYGAWQLLVQVASKCPTRGVLADEDGPLDAEALSLKTECPKDVFETALKVLSSREIGWIEIIDAPSTVNHTPSAIDCTPDTDVQTDVTNKTKRDETDGGIKAPVVIDEVVLEFPTAGKETHWYLTAAKLREYQQTYPDLGVLAECRKARQWCVDNRANRKTANGMPAFLSRWLSKSQDDPRRQSVQRKSTWDGAERVRQQEARERELRNQQRASEPQSLALDLGDGP